MGGHSSTLAPPRENSMLKKLMGLSVPLGEKLLGENLPREKLKKKANNTMLDLMINHFSTVATIATEKVQIFHHLVTIVDKKAPVTYKVILLRNEAHKYRQSWS